MDLAHIVLLVAAGLAAGVVNAIAGGGSLITFPSLIAVGLPSVDANVTNSIAVFPGYVSSVAGSRADLAGQGRRLRAIVPTSLAGTAIGCALLLGTPARAFEVIVPFLVLGAAAILFFQERLRALVGRSSAKRGQPTGRSSAEQGQPTGRSSAERAEPTGPSASESGSSTAEMRRSSVGRKVGLQAVVFVGAIYGGYFGAALGVMYVAALALVLDETLSRINALKNVLSACVGLVTVVVFAIFAPVHWGAALTIAPATIIGGYAGAHLARRLPARVLKVLIVGFGTVIGLVLLWRAFG
jgi:uncharacterized membrane protein YfcA